MVKLVFLILAVAIASVLFLFRTPAPSVSPTPFPLEPHIQNLITGCSQKNFKCYEIVIKRTFAEFGAQAAYTVLAKAAKESSDVEYHCHTLMHYLGEDAVASASGSIPKTLAQGGMACQSGYGHGALEEFFGGTPENELPQKLPTVCRGETHCSHMLGHGLGFLYDNDVYRAVTRCEYLSGDGEQEACFAGVFMENFGSDGRIHKPRFFSKDNPAAMCETLDARYRSSCLSGLDRSREAL